MGYGNNHASTVYVDVDFTSAAATVIAMPENKRGTVVEFGLEQVTTTLAADTTANRLQLGTSTDADAYCDVYLADAEAAGDMRHADAKNADNANQKSITTTNTGNGMIDLQIDGDDDLVLTSVAGTDASAVAGVGKAKLVVIWH